MDSNDNKHPFSWLPILFGAITAGVIMVQWLENRELSTMNKKLVALQTELTTLQITEIKGAPPKAAA